MQSTRLYPTNRNVDNENDNRLKALQMQHVIFNARDSGTARNQLNKTCAAKDRLELREGAQVVLLKNINATKHLVNGARGVVMNFVAHEESMYPKYPRVQFANGECRTVKEATFTIQQRGRILATRVQLPLGLAWALTIHKCQGMSLDCAQIDLANCFEYGQAYVALSRMRDIQG